MTDSPTSTGRRSRYIAALDAIVKLMAGRTLKNRKGQIVDTWSKLGSLLFYEIFPESVQADDLTIENVTRKLIPIFETILTNLRNAKAGDRELRQVLADHPRLRKKKK